MFPELAVKQSFLKQTRGNIKGSLRWSPGKAAGRKVITVRKQVLDAGRGFNPAHRPGSRAETARPGACPAAHSLDSFTLFYDVATLKVFFQQTHPACASCLRLN